MKRESRAPWHRRRSWNPAPWLVIALWDVTGPILAEDVPVRGRSRDEEIRELREELELQRKATEALEERLPELETKEEQQKTKEEQQKKDLTEFGTALLLAAGTVHAADAQRGKQTYGELCETVAFTRTRCPK